MSTVSVHAGPVGGHAPQSAAHCEQLSDAWQMPSPHKGAETSDTRVVTLSLGKVSVTSPPETVMNPRSAWFSVAEVRVCRTRSAPSSPVTVTVLSCGPELMTTATRSPFGIWKATGFRSTSGDVMPTRTAPGRTCLENCPNVK